jgi:hypothetical protein
MNENLLFTGQAKGKTSFGEILQSKPWGNWSPIVSSHRGPLNLITIPLPTTYECIFDFSIYQSDYGHIGCTYNSQVNWRGLKNNGVKFVIFRVGGPYWVDASFLKHAAAAKEAGIIYGFYYWVDPTKSPKANAEGLKAHVDRFSPILIAPDIEQFWYWDDWDSFLSGRITWDRLLEKRLPNTQIGNVVTAVFDYMKTLKNIKTIGYSGWWFGGQDGGLYPEVGDLFEKYEMDYWNAHYLLKAVPPERYIKVDKLTDIFYRIPPWETQRGCVSPEKTSLLQITSQLLLTGPTPGDTQSSQYDMSILKPDLNLFDWLGLGLGPDDPIETGKNKIFLPIVSK